MSWYLIGRTCCNQNQLVNVRRLSVAEGGSLSPTLRFLFARRRLAEPLLPPLSTAETVQYCCMPDFFRSIIDAGCFLRTYSIIESSLTVSMIRREVESPNRTPIFGTASDQHFKSGRGNVTCQFSIESVHQIARGLSNPIGWLTSFTVCLRL